MKTYSAFKSDFVIADTHFFHNRIVEFCNRPEDHMERMINSWKEIISEEDRIYHLGDIGFGSKEMLKELFDELPGYKVLIKGNHDTRSVQWYKDIGFDQVHNKPLLLVKDNKSIVLSHYPLNKEEAIKEYKQIDTNGIINLHGHIHNNPTEGLDKKFHYNCSVEVTDYKPQLISTILLHRNAKSK